MELNALNFMQRIGRKIAFATVRADNNGNSIYNKNILSCSVSPCNSAHACSAFCTYSHIISLTLKIITHFFKTLNNLRRFLYLAERGKLPEDIRPVEVALLADDNRLHIRPVPAAVGK